MQISIITPSYNQSKWLKLALASVQDQTESGCAEHGARRTEQKYKGGNAERRKAETPGIKHHAPSDTSPLSFSVEHIVMDGGSTDGTVAMLEAWSMEHGGKEEAEISPAQDYGETGGGQRSEVSKVTEPHAPHPVPYSFRYTSEADAGMYDAINKGFDLSTGEILAYLNCDEQYLPGVLRIVSTFFEENPEVDILFGDALLVNEEKPCAYRRMILPEKKHLETSPLNTLTCSTFFRRKIFDSGLRYDPLWKVIGDKAWVYEALQKRIAMAVIQKPLAAYYFTGVNMSESSRAKRDLREWRQSHPGSMWLFYRFRHRLKKLLAGAYGKKDIETYLYTKDFPDHRISTGLLRLSYQWRKPGPENPQL